MDLQLIVEINLGKIKDLILKFRLLNEKLFLPTLAMGLRDIGGNGNFSSEYLVAHKIFW